MFSVHRWDCLPASHQQHETSVKAVESCEKQTENKTEHRISKFLNCWHAFSAAASQAGDSESGSFPGVHPPGTTSITRVTLSLASVSQALQVTSTDTRTPKRSPIIGKSLLSVASRRARNSAASPSRLVLAPGSPHAAHSCCTNVTSLLLKKRCRHVSIPWFTSGRSIRHICAMRDCERKH